MVLEELVASAGLIDAIAPATLPDGSIRLDNVFRVVVART